MHQLLDAYFRTKQLSLLGQAQPLNVGLFGLERALPISCVVGRVHVRGGHEKLIEFVLHLGVFKGLAKCVASATARATHEAHMKPAAATPLLKAE